VQAWSKKAHFFMGYALLVLTYALVALRLEPGAALPATASVEKFSAERAISTLRRILGPGERPHPMGSAANRAVADRIVEVLRERGYAPEIVEGTACGKSALCGRARNILVRGHDAWPRILIAAHYDSVPAGPGAADDGAGVATLLELSRAVADGAAVIGRPWFLFTDGEEVDLLGAEVFVRQNVTRFDFVLNLDARGTGGPVLMFQTNPESAQAVRWYAEASRHPVTSSLLHSIYELLPNDTDFTVLDRGGEPGLNFAFIGHPLRYHSAVDRVDVLDPRSVQHQGQQLLDLLSTPPPEATPGRLVYFDVLGWALVAWSEGWNAVVAAAALVACVAGAVRLAAGRRALLHAAMTWASIPVLGGLGWALVALHGTSWAAEPAGFEAAALSFGVLGGVTVSVLAARWVSPGRAFSSWCLLSSRVSA
jgi:Peptidase family M28